MNVIAPNVKNLVRGGAIIYFDRGNTGAYRDLGNIPTFASSTPTQFVEHKTARSGAIIMDRREPTEFSNAYKFGVEEMNVKNLEMLFNAAAGTTLSQASGAGTLTIANPALDSAYNVGARQLSAVVAKKAGTVTLTSGTDYILESDFGMISFPATGGVLSTDTVTVTYTKATVSGDTIAPLSKNAAISGAAIIFFRSSDGKLWVRKHTNVQMSFTGDTPWDGAQFAKSEGELLFMPDYSNPAQPFGTMDMLPSP